MPTVTIAFNPEDASDVTKAGNLFASLTKFTVADAKTAVATLAAEATRRSPGRPAGSKNKDTSNEQPTTDLEKALTGDLTGPTTDVAAPTDQSMSDLLGGGDTTGQDDMSSLLGGTVEETPVSPYAEFTADQCYARMQEIFPKIPAAWLRELLTKNKAANFKAIPIDVQRAALLDADDLLAKKA